MKSIVKNDGFKREYVEGFVGGKYYNFCCFHFEVFPFWRFIVRLKIPGIEKFDVFVWPIWRRHHTRWMLQMLTYIRHWWPLSSECSLTCYTSWWSSPSTRDIHTCFPDSLEPSLRVLTTNVCPDRRSNPHLLHARRTLYH